MNVRGCVLGYRGVSDPLFGVVGVAPDGEFTAPIGGTVVAPGGQGIRGATAPPVDGAPASRIPVSRWRSA
jgi:hypothetical protein